MVNVLLFLLVLWLIVTVLGVSISEQTKKAITIILIILIVLWFFGGYTGAWPAKWPRC